MNHQHNHFAVLTILLLFILVSISCSFPGSEWVPVESAPQVCPTCEPCEACVGVDPVATVATATPEAQPEPTQTPAPIATAAPTNTPNPTSTLVQYLYRLQPGTPSYIPNIHHMEYGDQWMGVGGQVFGSDGLPVEFVVVRVQGVLDGKRIDLTSMTGVAEQFGPGGYEVQLAGFGVDSIDSLVITLFDLQGQQLSAMIPFATYNNPDELQIVINFVTQ